MKTLTFKLTQLNVIHEFDIICGASLIMMGPNVTIVMP